MSSSMRNAIQRRNHKERSQPYERSKWGLLEKRKDYQLRSRDFNAKKLKKAQLSAIAKERNPDEFYHGMIHAKTRDGGIKVTERGDGNQELSVEQVKLLKTQDAGYVRLQAEMERRKIEQLENKLVFADGEGVKRKHTVFVESKEQARDFDTAQFFGTHQELVDRAYNRPRLEQLAQGGFGEQQKIKGEDEADAEWRRKEDKKERVAMARGREQAYKELEARMKREKDLLETDRALELQRAKMGKGAATKSNKWAKTRKR
ncbi:small-subunit processome [Pyronema omphalodes]|nr:small-subunit processome [Pyronema omphalodes]